MAPFNTSHPEVRANEGGPWRRSLPWWSTRTMATPEAGRSTGPTDGQLTATAAPQPADPEARFAPVPRGDLAGLMRLYAADAVVSLPRGREAAGHIAIRAAFAEALAAGARWAEPDSVRVIETGALAMTSPTSPDGVVRTQVAAASPTGAGWVRDGVAPARRTRVDLLGAA